MPSALAPILPALFVPNGRLVGALQSLVAGVYKGPLAGLQTFFAVSHDSASGRLGLEDDRIALTWPGANNEPVYARLDAALQALATGVGASYVRNPLALTMMGSQPATAGNSRPGRRISQTSITNPKASTTRIMFIVPPIPLLSKRCAK